MEKSDILIIMGNGPSMKDIDINLVKKFDSFGLNAAYRIYDKINFRPTYFGCFDFIVCQHHSDDFKKLIDEDIIQKFFFAKQQPFKEYYDNPKFVKFNLPMSADAKKIGSQLTKIENLGCSGSNAAQCGIIMGYKKIILIGCDCNYVEKINEAVEYNSCLKIDKTPENNPNYWFDDYQVKGDIYNKPQAARYHVSAWKRLADYKPDDVDIVNCSPSSKITNFRKSTLEKELENFL